MKHCPARLTTATLLSFLLLAWGKTSAAGTDAAATPANNARRRSLRGANSFVDQTNAYHHDHNEPLLPGVPDQQPAPYRSLRPNTPLDQPVIKCPSCVPLCPACLRTMISRKRLVPLTAHGTHQQ